VKIAKDSIKQMHTLRTFTKESKQLLQNQQVNALMPLKKISKSTFSRAYALSCGEEKMKCSDSYSGRAQALLDWRNPIGTCATWNCCLSLRKPVKPCNIWSGDDVAVVINPDTQRLQIVRITKAERDRLNRLHLTPGAMASDSPETEASNVVCKCFNLVNAEGYRGPITAKLLDYNFKWPENPDQWCAFYPVNKMENLFVACVNRKHPNYNEVTYFEDLFVKVILPFVVEYRDKKRGRKIAAIHSQASQSPNGGIVVDFDDGERIIVTLDGNYPGIEAIIARVGKIMNEVGVEAFKWAGGTTLVEQPADVADSHKEFHKAAASETFRYDEHGAPTKEMEDFIEFFKMLGPTGARLHTHVRFLRHFEWMVDKAWTKHGITEGWRISGMWPFNAANILGGWGGWKHVPTEKAQQIVDLCTDVNGDAFHEIAKDKFLDDLKAQNIFGHLIEDDEYKIYMTDKAPNVATSNMRSLMMNTKAFNDDCSYMEMIWEQRRISEARLQAALGEVIEGVQMCICGAKLPKDVAKHLNTKLHKEKCRK
jgi:hypothetical protein